MGSAWCKNRAETTDDSKSTVGRVIVRCVNQMCPAQRSDPAAAPRQTTPVPRLEDDKEAAFTLWGKPQSVVTPPLPERPPPHGTVSSSAWESAVLTVPEPEPPVPPPRTKRRRRRRSSQPLTRSLSFSVRPASANTHSDLRRTGSACELSVLAEPEVEDLPKLVFDFTSYNSVRTPPPSPSREDTHQQPTTPQRSRDILRDLGLPSSLREEEKLGLSRASSGRSSMTPSLSELEAALSDLLEAGATRDDDEETESSVVRAGHYHQAPSLPKEVIA